MKRKPTPPQLVTMKDLYALAAQIGLNANPNLSASDRNIAVRSFDQAEEMMNEKKFREGKIYE